MVGVVWCVGDAIIDAKQKWQHGYECFEKSVISHRTIHMHPSKLIRESPCRSSERYASLHQHVLVVVAAGRETRDDMTHAIELFITKYAEAIQHTVTRLHGHIAATPESFLRYCTILIECCDTEAGPTIQVQVLYCRTKHQRLFDMMLTWLTP